MPTTPILASSNYGSVIKDGTYKGKGYLKEMTLIYPELTTNLSKPKKFIPIRQISTDES